MPRTTSHKKLTDKPETSNSPILRSLPLELLSPEQYESVTRANFYHPESRLIMQLFLQTNYLWQLARKIQQQPDSIASIQWPVIERSTAKIINDSLEKLLIGIDNSPWKPKVVSLAVPAETSSKPVKRNKVKPTIQACGCRTKHSDAAGVIEACQLGKEQGSDESWHGY